MKIRVPVVTLLAIVAASSAAMVAAQSTMKKTLIDYFQPTSANGPLSSDIWGAAAVGPRDPKNGLEDTSMKHWNYWDGQIIHGPDGKYHMFASRWD